MPNTPRALTFFAPLHLTLVERTVKNGLFQQPDRGRTVLNLFWLGNPLFGNILSSFGWRVHVHDVQTWAPYTWDDVVAMAGFEPDVFVFSDKSLPPFALGVETFPCATVCYAVDTHIHSWLPFYGQAFDLCLVSLRDHMAFFRNKRLEDADIHWCPPSAKIEDRPVLGVQPQWDCLFVGTLHTELTPKRVTFLRELKRHIPSLHVQQGSYAELFPLGRTLLNHCEQGDMNFRIFEAMACGGCLVTPRISHGFDTLFTHGKECLLYNIKSPHDAARNIKKLLDTPRLAEEMASQAVECIDAGHRFTHRAQMLTNILQNTSAIHWQQRIQARHTAAENIREKYLRMPYLLFAEAYNSPLMKKIYLQAALAAR